MTEAGTTEKNSVSGAALASIWARHSDDALASVEALEDAVAALIEDSLSHEGRRAAEREAHRLAGSAGTFGFLQASESARQLEWIFAGTEAIPPDRVLTAADQVVALRTAFETGPSPAPGSGTIGVGDLAQTGPDCQTRAEEIFNAATALVVDDDPAVLEAVGAVLDAAGMRTVGLEDPARFWTTLEDVQPDLLILDLDMPRLRGDELCRAVRGDPRWAGLPVLFITAHTRHDTLAAIFAAGADDFIAKPLRGPELLGRVRNRLERARHLRASAEEGPLSALVERQHAGSRLGELLGRAEQDRRPFSVAVLSIDNLEEIAELHGQEMAERMLRRIEALLERSLPCEGLAAQWHKGEFLLGMHLTTREEAERHIASLLVVLRNKRFISAAGSRIPVVFSAGVAAYPFDASTVTGLREAAFRAAVQAKRDGGDQMSPAASSGRGHSVDVVIVEDDDALAELLEHALTTAGYRSRRLGSGQEAARQLTADPPDLQARVVLLDVNLPGLNGFGVLRRMAAAGTLSGTRVIMLTARAGEREILESLELGAFDHVAKPFNVPVLMHRISRALGV